MQAGSFHAECLVLEGVLQQDNKEKQPYKANYCNLTQHTVHLFSGVKNNSHEQVDVRTLELLQVNCISSFSRSPKKLYCIRNGQEENQKDLKAWFLNEQCNKKTMGSSTLKALL